jgi:hypothetical protein
VSEQISPIEPSAADPMQVSNARRIHLGPQSLARRIPGWAKDFESGWAVLERGSQPPTLTKSRPLMRDGVSFSWGEPVVGFAIRDGLQFGRAGVGEVKVAIDADVEQSVVNAAGGDGGSARDKRVVVVDSQDGAFGEGQVKVGRCGVRRAAEYQIRRSS